MMNEFDREIHKGFRRFGKLALFMFVGSLILALALTVFVGWIIIMMMKYFGIIG